MNNRNTALFAAALLASAVLIPAASAQVGFLEEVIVTAEKRETTIQDTPIAVSAFSQDDLERGLINNSMDIQMAVPSMLMTRDFFTTSNISIRGVGNLAVGSASEAGVGVHFNGVYVNAPRIFETEFFDTERVEVLRGPQGTLYGRNTTAGVVNVISKKAGDESEGFVDASYGDYNYARFRGALNIPLTDVLSQRFSIYRTSRDGFVENIHTGNEVDDRDIFAVRSSTAFNFSENTNAHLTVQYFREDDSRMRGSNHYCTPDPDGILGCLPNRDRDAAFGGAPHTGGGGTNGTVSGYLTNAVNQGLTDAIAAANAGLGVLAMAGISDAGQIPLPTSGRLLPENDAEGAIKPTDLRKVNMDFEPRYEVDETLISLEFNHSFGDINLFSLTGFQKSDLDARNDYDFTANIQRWSTELNKIQGDLARAQRVLAANRATATGGLQQGATLADAGAMQATQGAEQAAAAGMTDLAAMLTAQAAELTARATGARAAATALSDTSDSGLVARLPFLPLAVRTTYQRGPDGPRPVAYLEQNDRSSAEPEQWSQEFRLSSDFDGPLNFLAGAFYVDYKTEVHYYVYSSALSLAGQNNNIPENQRLYDNDTRYELETWALFGELYYDIRDDMELTVGLRYSDDTKESRQRTIYLTAFADPNALGGGYEPFKFETDEFTGKINLNYQLDDDILLYGTLSRSYKSGGFNPITSTQIDAGLPREFDSEFINALEFGAKTRFLNNTLQANVTAYYYDYEDLQVSKIVNQTSINENTDADIFGLEGELLWAPDEHWRVLLNLSLLNTDLSGLDTFDPADPNRMGTTDMVRTHHSRGLDNFVTSDKCPADALYEDDPKTPNVNENVPGKQCSGLPVSVDGNELPGAPAVTSFLSVSYGFPIGNGMRLDVSGSYYWQDEFYTRIFNTKDDLLESWDVINASVVLTSAQEDWYVELWGRNLNDDDHWTGQQLQDPALGLFRTIQLLEPRTYGITAGYSF